MWASVAAEQAVHRAALRAWRTRVRATVRSAKTALRHLSEIDETCCDFGQAMYGFRSLSGAQVEWLRQGTDAESHGRKERSMQCSVAWGGMV
ncbi:hypothetical protein ACV229_06695 [Burkholderia sp. MR1-5-21]